MEERGDFKNKLTKTSPGNNFSINFLLESDKNDKIKTSILHFLSCFSDPEYRILKAKFKFPANFLNFSLKF